MRSAEFQQIVGRMERYRAAEQALRRVCWPSGWPSNYVDVWLSLAEDRRRAEAKIAAIVWC